MKICLHVFSDDALVQFLQKVKAANSRLRMLSWELHLAFSSISVGPGKPDRSLWHVEGALLLHGFVCYRLKIQSPHKTSDLYPKLPQFPYPLAYKFDQIRSGLQIVKSLTRLSSSLCMPPSIFCSYISLFSAFFISRVARTPHKPACVCCHRRNYIPPNNVN